MCEENRFGVEAALLQPDDALVEELKDVMEQVVPPDHVAEEFCSILEYHRFMANEMLRLQVKKYKAFDDGE